MIVIVSLIFIGIIVVITLIIVAGEFDLEHRQSGTSHSVLSSLQKVSGDDYDDDDNDDDNDNDNDDDDDDVDKYR